MGAGQTGIFGYTTYSATKFALRGFAEALRMEMRPHGVGVSLTFPPDTDTPLLAREMENKPIECKKISASAGLFSAAYVAKVMWNGALARDVQIGFGLDG